MAKGTNELKKGKSYFSLVGLAKITSYTFTIDKESASSPYIYNRMNLGVDCGNGNVVYSEMMGGFFPDGSTKIYAKGKDASGRDDYKNALVLDWDERLDQNVLDDIGPGSFIRISLEKDVKGKSVESRFLSAYDAIQYVKDNLTDNTAIGVSGVLEYSVYDGETQVKKKITSIYLKDTTKENYEPKAEFTQTFLIRKDFRDKINTEKNTITAFGYVPEYVSKVDGKDIKRTLLLPKTFEFDLNLVPESAITAMINKLVPFKAGYLTEIAIDGLFREGVSTVVATLDDLPEELKFMVDCGAMTAEKALSQAVITGSKEKKIVFKQFHFNQVVNKEDDGTETTTKKVAVVGERYLENEIEFYADITDDEFLDSSISKTNITTSANQIDETNLDFLNSLTQ